MPADLELGNGQVFRFSGYRQNNLLAKLDYELGAHKLSLSYTSYDDEGRKPWANRRGEMPTVSEFNIKKYGSFDAAEYANTALNSYKDRTVSLNYRYTPASPLWDLQLALSSSSNDRHWVRPQVAFDKMFVSVGNFGHESWLEYDRDFIDINNTSQLGDHLLTVGAAVPLARSPLTGIQQELSEQGGEKLRPVHALLPAWRSPGYLRLLYQRQHCPDG